MKKDILIVGIVILSAMLIAYVINISLSYGNFINTSLTGDSWLNFWGGYCGGVFAAVVGYLAIIYSNRNSEKAIKQQFELLRVQDRRKQIDEYSECLKNNLELLNVVDIKGITSCMNLSDLSVVKKEIVKRKSRIYSYDLQLRYIFQFDVRQDLSELEKSYYKQWEKSRIILSKLLDKQMDMVYRVGQNQSDYNSQKIHQNIIYNVEQILKIETDETKKKAYAKDRDDSYSCLVELKSQIEKFKPDIDVLMKDVGLLSAELLLNAKGLFDLSILLLKEKEISLRL